RLEGVAMVVEAPRPLRLIVGEDDGIGLGGDIADARRRIGLRVGAVDNNLVGRPLARLGPPLQRLGGHADQSGLEPRRAVGVALDQGLALEAAQRHQLSGAGRSDLPIRKRSTPRAALRPSAMAHTMSDCPRCMSPAAKTPGTLVIQLASLHTLPRSV